MAKKKRVPLPRVTIMAYNRRDLVAFVQSVETLRLLIDDLRVLVATKKSGARKPAPPAPTAAAAAV